MNVEVLDTKTGGQLTVGVLTEEWDAIYEYGCNTTTPIRAGGVHMQVRWGNRGLTHLKHRVVRFEFCIIGMTLWAFQVNQAIAT